MQSAMSEASRAVLAGFEISTDLKIIKWPDRYEDERGRVMWARVCDLVASAERRQGG